MVVNVYTTNLMLITKVIAIALVMVGGEEGAGTWMRGVCGGCDLNTFNFPSFGSYQLYEECGEGFGRR